MKKYSADQLTHLLTNVLRHTPEDLGLTLDAQGWTSVDVLVREANKRGLFISVQDIVDEALKNERNRFSLSEDKKLIRANHGHSVSVDVGLKEIIPGKVLYHRTKPEFVESILENGLVPQGRLYVHLASTREYLTPYDEFSFSGEDYVILRIDSEAMVKDGYIFYASGEFVICTKEVPSKYISVERD